MLKARLLAGGGAETLYVDDVFSAYTYTGNGTTQTITNGIDLAGDGGLVWIKQRTSGAHSLFDTARGGEYWVGTHTTIAQQLNSLTDGRITSFNSDGFTLGTSGGNQTPNGSGFTQVAWTFRKAPKFFDVVTYTGNGVAGRSINHSLGQAVGMLIVKRTDAASGWRVYHGGALNSYFTLSGTAAVEADNGVMWGNGLVHTAPTATTFTISSFSELNASGGTYVAYLFAHDASTDGIVQCGSFTTDGSGNATVNHGWSAGVQFAVIKASSTTGDWEMYDTARTAAWSGSDARLRANLSNAEDSVSRLSASGTSVSFAGLSSSATYAYLFIVAPT